MPLTEAPATLDRYKKERELECKRRAGIIQDGHLNGEVGRVTSVLLNKAEAYRSWLNQIKKGEEVGYDPLTTGTDFLDYRTGYGYGVLNFLNDEKMQGWYEEIHLLLTSSRAFEGYVTGATWQAPGIEDEQEDPVDMERQNGYRLGIAVAAARDLSIRHDKSGTPSTNSSYDQFLHGLTLEQKRRIGRGLPTGAALNTQMR